MFLSALSPKIECHYSNFSYCNTIISRIPKHHQFSKLYLSARLNKKNLLKPLACIAKSEKPDSNSDHDTKKTKVHKKVVENSERILPATIPEKPRRGRKSETAACEDIIRDSLEKTFASIREQNSETEDHKEKVMRHRVDEESISDSSSDESADESDENDTEKKMVVEEESCDWPLDADVGWGIRASEYFDKHPIKNVVGDDSFEIDWEGEADDNWVKEINCLEWESFSFHPSPLVVLVFERYNRVTRTDGDLVWLNTMESNVVRDVPEAEINR